MASLRQIKRRMKSIENIHEITKAMEMIAGFRLKKAETRFNKAKPYLLEMEKLTANLSGAVPEDFAHPLFQERKSERKALVVMTGDKGLCGAYNSNVIKNAMQWLKQNSGVETFLIPVGKVGAEYFKKRTTPFLFSYPERGMGDPALARKITEDLKSAFLGKKVDSVEILYTSFRLGGTGRNSVNPYLPLGYFIKKEKSLAVIEYIYEPDFQGVFEPLIARYLEGKIYLNILESLTSEYSARMAAMKQATENGEEVLDNLTLMRNKTRQATITRELSEIVSGSSVLV